MRKNLVVNLMFLFILFFCSFASANRYIYQYDEHTWKPIISDKEELNFTTGRWYSVTFFYTEEGSLVLNVFPDNNNDDVKIEAINYTYLNNHTETPIEVVLNNTLGVVYNTNNTNETRENTANLTQNTTAVVGNMTDNTTNSTIIVVNHSEAIIPKNTNNLEVDYRNAFMIGWDGTACENIKYAQNMGYDYVMHMEGMEKCPGPINLKFYYESPDALIPAWQIFYNKNYTQQQIELYNRWYLWKSAEPFPNNLATGWFYGDGSFRPLPNLQQQWVIDQLINKSITVVKSRESKAKNFTFGGYAWDVPQLDGDLWSDLQYLEFYPNRANGTGRQITINYWTGTCSGVNPNNDYPCYTDGKAEMYKQLFSKTRQLYPDMKVYLEPYNVWNSYFKGIDNRTDKYELVPDFVCSESVRTDFLTDPRILKYLPTTKMCSDTPDTARHSENLKLAGTLATKGAWFIWFGRIGGTGDFAPLPSMKEVPDRLKLIRALVGWDNLNNVPLNNRSFINNVYRSSMSYADNNIIYSVNPKNKYLYVVVLNNTAKLPFDKNATLYKLDNLMGITNQTINIEDIATGAAFIVVDEPLFNSGSDKVEIPQDNTNSSTTITQPLPNESKGYCGDGICIGRNATNYGSYESGLNAENWDNCPQDCGFQYNARSIASIYTGKAEFERQMIEFTTNTPDTSYEVIGQTIQGKNILMFKLGNGEGTFMFDGQVHGVEDCGTETGRKFFEWAATSNEQDAIDIREKNTLYFIPIINRDSYARQNMRRSYTLFDTILSVPYGVDLNRNFPAGFGSSGSNSANDSYQYRGLYGGSEPETQAVMYAINKYKPDFYMNVHCGMEFYGIYGNQTRATSILNNIKQISNKTGSKTLTAYSPHYNPTASGGYVARQGCTTSGSACALFEISEWGNLPKTLDDYHKRWWPSAFPVYLAGAESVR